MLPPEYLIKDVYLQTQHFEYWLTTWCAEIVFCEGSGDVRSRSNYSEAETYKAIGIWTQSCRRCTTPPGATGRDLQPSRTLLWQSRFLKAMTRNACPHRDIFSALNLMFLHLTKFTWIYIIYPHDQVRQTEWQSLLLQIRLKRSQLLSRYSTNTSLLA